MTFQLWECGRFQACSMGGDRVAEQLGVGLMGFELLSGKLGTLDEGHDGFQCRRPREPAGIWRHSSGVPQFVNGKDLHALAHDVGYIAGWSPAVQREVHGAVRFVAHAVPARNEGPAPADRRLVILSEAKNLPLTRITYCTGNGPAQRAATAGFATAGAATGHCRSMHPHSTMKL